MYTNVSLPQQSPLIPAEAFNYCFRVTIWLREMTCSVLAEPALNASAE